MKTLFQTIAKSWKAFVSHKRLIPIAVLVDVLFLYGLTRLHYELFTQASVHATKLLAMISQQVEEIGQSDAVTVFSQSPEFVTAYNALLKYIGIFFASAIIIWLVGKGIVWFIAHKTAEKKTPVLPFVGKFIGMTLFWFVAFMLLLFLGLQSLSYAQFGAFPILGETSTNIIMLLLFWIFMYFVFISYSVMPIKVFKQTFVLGVKHWKKLLPVHVVNSLIFFVATTVPISLVRINVELSLAVIVLILLPAIAWSRIFWVTAVQEVMRYG